MLGLGTKSAPVMFFPAAGRGRSRQVESCTLGASSRLIVVNESFMQRLTAAHDSAHMVGWDFSRLAGRMEADGPDWDLDGMCVGAMATAESVLDVGTGGGERLLRLLDRLDQPPTHVAATEGWMLNVSVARETLAPLGIDVAEYDSEDGDPMPFPSGAFDLVMAAHESYDPSEVARVLRDGGLLLTQQVHGRDGEELREWFGGQPTYPHVTLEHYSAAAAAAGFGIDSQGEWSGSMRFVDAEALVEYMGLVPWDVPEFTVESHLAKLMELDANQPIIITQRRFWLAARKGSAAQGKA